MRQRTYKLAWITTAILLVWLALSWVIAQSYFHYRIEEVLKQERAVTELRSHDLADSIRRNLDYIKGLPDLFSKLDTTASAVTEFGRNVSISLLTYEQRKIKWTSDPLLRHLDLHLGIAVSNLKVDSIYVLNVDGDCIASAGWNAADSCIGLNYSDRDYFQKARIGTHGMQYVVDRFSHIPGIYFSSPISIRGKFFGAVIAKVNMPSLAFLVNSQDAFVTDKNGVIIVAHDRSIEMHSLPDAPVNSMPAPERSAIYQRTNIPELRITPWENARDNGMVYMQNADYPYLLVSEEVPEYGLSVDVRKGLPSLSELNRIQVGFFMLSSLAGGFLILLTAGAYLHLGSIRRASEDLSHQANYDALTQLPNRRLFYDKLQAEIGESQRSGTPLALLLIDLDGFKEVNDTMGHNMGDTLLIQAAMRIKQTLRKSDTVARLGGDEFIVILSNYDSASTIDRIIQDILRRISDPFVLARQNAYVSASIGISLYPEDATDMEALVKRADQAMYAAKRSGRNRACYFVQSLEAAAQKHMRIINDLHEAMQQQQFSVHYQPIVDLNNGTIHKAEALVRWRHPERGLISPAEFIPLAETSGLITRIDNWVMGEVASQAGSWRTRFGDNFQISVNKSPVDFSLSSWRQEESWLASLQESGISGKNFCIEITEGLLLHADASINDKLIELRAAGVQIAIDDFGIGYSSLAYLKRFSIDYLKIDQSFVRDLPTDSDDCALCEAIIVMAHKLGLKVVAEGVETEQQRDMLASFGCDYAQGYLFSRPLPENEFELLLQNHSISQQSIFQKSFQDFEPKPT